MPVILFQIITPVIRSYSYIVQHGVEAQNMRFGQQLDLYRCMETVPQSAVFCDVSTRGRYWK
jgi:hypothetical protein